MPHSSMVFHFELSDSPSAVSVSPRYISVTGHVVKKSDCRNVALSLAAVGTRENAVIFVPGTRSENDKSSELKPSIVISGRISLLIVETSRFDAPGVRSVICNLRAMLMLVQSKTTPL